MKQIIQHLNTGQTLMLDVPVPQVKDNHVLIQSEYSLVSAGTERMLLEFSKANWLNKARQQPERVRAVLDKIKTDGLSSTLQAVQSKINKPIPLGYSNAGRVIAVGGKVRDFKVGDRVASNGPHAEVVQVSQHLVAKIPDNVDTPSAAFTVIGAIALQGIRLAQPDLGETFVVIGLGLIGQLTVQLLLANGCKVIGIDTDEQKCRLAAQSGASTYCNLQDEQLAKTIYHATQGLGADAAIITASTKSDSLISDAAQMLRKRGRIILVGVVGLALRRSDFYDKEISFQVSCSYGPGRYDFDYEENGLDYPPGFVRWTARRNFEAVLDAMSRGLLKTTALQSQQLPFEEYEKVYAHIEDNDKLASLFVYAPGQEHQSYVAYRSKKSSEGALALIGAGSFMAGTILPALRKIKLKPLLIASENGLSAAQLAKQFDIPGACTDLQAIWDNKDIQHVLIATPHDTHASLCIQAIKKAKHVFVEKPLAINREELEALKEAYTQGNSVLNVGFNRRYAPLAIQAKKLIQDTGAPLHIVMTINAGMLESKTWHADAGRSGGRIVGEIGHFIDLASFFIHAQVEAVCANRFPGFEDDATVLLRYADGSNVVINYFTNGHKAYDKERIELYSQGKTLVIENWKKLRTFGFKQSTQTSVQDKGHDAQFRLWAERLQQGADALIPFDEIYNTSLATIAIRESIVGQQWISIA